MRVLKPMLPPMPRSHRLLVHEYCNLHWSLSTSSVDPEPHRVVDVHKSHHTNAHTSQPLILLSEAVLHFAPLASNAQDLQDHIGSGLDANCACVGIWEIGAAGGMRASIRQVEDMLSVFLRKSEYTVSTVVSDSNMLVEFASARKAKKTLQMLQACHGRSGPIHWRCCQWWPAPKQWAARQ